jgi:hypothetical protein
MDLVTEKAVIQTIELNNNQSALNAAVTHDGHERRCQTDFATSNVNPTSLTFKAQANDPQRLYCRNLPDLLQNNDNQQRTRRTLDE